MNLYLIRHAQPITLTYKNTFPGPNLGDEGRAQAQTIANYLQDKAISQIYTSHYPRVIQTMHPFLETYKHPPHPIFDKALWEREASLESHESLVRRVHTWFETVQATIALHNTAIFSHCGPINMLLDYLDPQKQRLLYPFTCPYGCHTPLGGVWALVLDGQALVEGRLVI